MLSNQKHLFNLRPGVHYLNNAYKAPLLKASEAAAIHALARTRNPVDLPPEAFFEEVEVTKRLFAQLINADSASVAMIPSVSYGMASALKNIAAKKGQKALTIQDEFPSGYFALKRWCEQQEVALEVIHPEGGTARVGRQWNARILEQIDDQTAVVLLSSVHWINGVRFDLEAIGKRCREVDARLIVDGTQSVGALPLDVQAVGVDALICAAYKWLFGPYSTGFVYLNHHFDNGIPLEESWMNRLEAQEFSKLTNYEPRYKPQAHRYNVGETSNFILMPMLQEALRQVRAWQVPDIQAYAGQLTEPLYRFLEEKEVELEEPDFVAKHLFSLPLPKRVDPHRLKRLLDENQVYVSMRGTALRVAVSVYNTPEDIARLQEVIEQAEAGV